MDVDEIVEGVLKLVDQEGAQITDLVVEALYEGTIRCKSIKDEYLQKDDVKKAMEVYTKIARMYNQIADRIQDAKQCEILRMISDFWIQSRNIESELLKEKKHERTVLPKEYMEKQEGIVY
ncbi:MAG: hypothetical protein DRP10_02275 [Candidatus Aenigmatarchaeota archaeon]|nr:MAG: hypothetical protein DRP10_02275 [Candidatus Aenigmarchaeota archaeon]